MQGELGALAKHVLGVDRKVDTPRADMNVRFDEVIEEMRTGLRVRVAGMEALESRVGRLEQRRN